MLTSVKREEIKYNKPECSFAFEVRQGSSPINFLKIKINDSELRQIRKKEKLTY